jgi:hypothetical protein
VLRGRDVQDFEELKRQGLSILPLADWPAIAGKPSGSI